MLSENAVKVLEARYLLRDLSGDLIEDPDGMFLRVANHVGQHESPQTRQRFYEIMSNLKFLPNSPTLANAGKPDGQLSACFVLPVEDSMESIFETMGNMALVHKSGGGTGFSFTKLRPRGSTVQSTSGVATGPIPFMKLFDQVSETVKQGGMRHGANMGIVDWDHPDIFEFIHMKDGKDTLKNFNISVGVTSSLFWENTRLLEHIFQSAWETGDPGLVYLNRMNAGTANPVPLYGPILATNPCGEQPLYPYDSCNLGSIDLSKHLRRTPNPEFMEFDWDELGTTVRLAVRFLDDVITTNHYPLAQIQNVSQDIRRIGLGVMGWADALFKMKIPYSSPEAQALGTNVMAFINDIAAITSRQLADERGAFPAFPDSIYSKEKPIRNSTRTTIAPTGTISIIAGCSSGIEPNFDLYFKRQHKIDRDDPSKNVEMYEVNPVFQEWLTSIRAVVEDHPTPPPHFEVARDLDYMEHLKMQAAFQKYTDNAVSKTINLPNSATVRDVENAYRASWDLGLMGITVYRDGCRDEQVLSTPAPLPIAAPIEITLPEHQHYRKKLPIERVTIGRKVRIGEHEGYMHVGLYKDGTPGEIFFKMDREGSTVSSLVDSVCIAISVGLQYGVPLETFVQKYKGSKFEPAGFTNDEDIRNASSILDYIARWLERRFLLGDNITLGTDLCPDCGGALIYEEGCFHCQQPDCGYSRC